MIKIKDDENFKICQCCYKEKDNLKVLSFFRSESTFDNTVNILICRECLEELKEKIKLKLEEE